MDKDFIIDIAVVMVIFTAFFAGTIELCQPIDLDSDVGKAYLVYAVADPTYNIFNGTTNLV